MNKINYENCNPFSKDGCRLIHESEELKLIQKLTKLISESEDFNSALSIIMKTFCETTECEYAEVWTPQYNTNTLKCSNIWHTKNTKLDKFRSISENMLLKENQELPGRIWISKKYEWITDVTLENKDLFMRLKEVKKAGLKASFGLPIISYNKVQAILVFFFKKPYPKDNNIINLISTVTTQLEWVIKHKELEERFKNSFKYSSTGNAIIDISGKFLEVNKSLCSMLNYTEEQLLSLSIQNILSEDDLDDFLINIQKLLAKTTSLYKNDSKLHNRKNKIIWVNMEITIVFNSVNIPLYFIVQMQNISTLKRVEKEKKSLHKKLLSSQSEVKVLKSLLPICAWCKKIRNDDGDWENIEDYFSHYSNVDLTHGICDECLKKTTLI